MVADSAQKILRFHCVTLRMTAAQTSVFICVHLWKKPNTRTMPVLLCQQIKLKHLQDLLSPYGLGIEMVADNSDIPGSFWQPPEAGLIGDTLYIRNDTPVHSALHEACHYICMTQDRRATLHTDAGGKAAIEEDSTCYLQILLADHLAEMGHERMFSDMDEWGYSFRLGSARAWFEEDAEDAFKWLVSNGLIDSKSKPSWKVRQ